MKAEEDRPAAPESEFSAAPGVRPGHDASLQLPAAPVVWRRPLLRVGLYGWALLGVSAGAWVLWQVTAELSLVIIPLVIALFPAAVLAPVVAWLKERRVPAALAALIAIFGSLLLLAGIIAALTPTVSAQVDDFGRSLQEGIDSVEQWLASGPFGLRPIRLEDLIDRAQQQGQQLLSGGNVGSGVLGALAAVTESIAGTLFGLVALFFYLKDGPRIAEWIRSLFPRSMRADAHEVGVRAWQTLGAYIRGQLLIALIDAIAIGIALIILRVPLALPLSVLVFFGGLFPVVGAFLAGAVAVLVALATNGIITALIVLAVIVVIQEVEGDVLAPVILGKATELHALATLVALTAGAVLLGVLGAFLAIPVTASVTRAVKYIRDKQRASDPALA